MGQRYALRYILLLDYKGVSQNLLQYTLFDLLPVEHSHTVTVIDDLLHTIEIHGNYSETKKECSFHCNKQAQTKSLSSKSSSWCTYFSFISILSTASRKSTIHHVCVLRILLRVHAHHFVLVYRIENGVAIRLVDCVHNLLYARWRLSVISPPLRYLDIQGKIGKKSVVVDDVAQHPIQSVSHFPLCRLLAVALLEKILCLLHKHLLITGIFVVRNALVQIPVLSSVNRMHKTNLSTPYSMRVMSGSSV